MAHDPRREDYQRLALRFALSIADPSEAARSFSTFGQRFARDRDSLPQTDADRAFHLMATAAEIIDYRLPFTPESGVESLTKRAEELLDEALSLDPSCHDAVRIRHSLRSDSHEERYRFLAERVEAVRASCEEDRERSCASLANERRALGESIAMRPYWRWLSSMAELALICGHNHAAIDAAEHLLTTDTTDFSDVRLTLAYALAKLEDERGMERLLKRYRALSVPRCRDDAWILIAQVALAHKRCDLAGARALLARLLENYPGCAGVLIRQTELPDSKFARLRVPHYGEDELILAVSEGIVLLQEGSERSGRGVFGAWLAQAASELDPAAAMDVAREIARREERGL